MNAERLFYADPDDPRDMATDASACRAEPHVTGSTGPRRGTRRTVDVHSRLLGPDRHAAKTVLVDDRAARFAARLFD